MMRFSAERHAVKLLSAGVLVLALQAQPISAQTPASPQTPAPAQTAAPAPNLVDQLIGSDSESDIDLAALRQKAADRIQTRADVQALRRPLIAPQLLKLPLFDFDVVFDPDSSLVRPQSYQVIGRIADALSDPKLLPYTFLIVDHTESTGSRKENLALSQKRAESIRVVLAGAFKISPKRLHALGLGEEQLRDAARPTSPANARAQILTLGKLPPEAPKTTTTAPAAKKGAAAKSKRRSTQ
jgi:outer membrane protein OmpA-like peptidoglycan-associated protein